MYMPPNTGSTDFAPPPEGTHLAVCYRVIDLGTQTTEWNGETKRQHKVLLSWELPDEPMPDGEKAGQPFTIHQRYTFSSHEKSRLRKDLEAWRGKKFTEADFGPGGFDIKNVIGVGCYLTVLHSSKGDRTYANVEAIMKLPKGTTPSQPINPQAYLSLDNFDVVVFDGLSDGLKEAIRKSPEYIEATGGTSASHRADASADHVPDDQAVTHDPDDLDDEIPF